jgi:catechol 2,3-dioxygenase-like lactoylglutathione lyase family enzyme
MTKTLVEHVNVTVRDPARTASVLEKIFGWHERWRGPARAGGTTIHVGSEDHYVALYTDPKATYSDQDFAKGAPLNHIGIVVDDLDRVESRVIEAGLAPFNHANYAPGRRFYFFDPDGIEYEVVSYA